MDATRSQGVNEIRGCDRGPSDGGEGAIGKKEMELEELRTVNAGVVGRHHMTGDACSRWIFPKGTGTCTYFLSTGAPTCEESGKAYVKTEP